MKTEYRILIVDDEGPIKNLLVTFLTSQGHQCDTAMNGVEALKKANQHHYDAVITDIAMPEMDGIALTQKLSQRFSHLSIMVMTGFYDEYSADNAVAAGAREFIKKPFPLTEFHTRFQRMMRDRELFHQIQVKKEEVEKASNEMILGLQKESLETIERLRKELEGLRKKKDLPD